MNELPSLYVSNLPKENFLDLDFFKFFTSKGYKVKNAKIVTDSKTNKSRGYGYLQFVEQTEADRCQIEMNNKTLMGLALRIVKSDPEPKFNKESNLLVKNIAQDVTQQEIFEKFKAYGNVVSCKLETYPNSKESRGYAYVQFDNVEEAKKAIEALNNQDFKGKKLEVTTKIDKEELKKGKDPKPSAIGESNNLFVKNLPAGTNDDKLKALFAEFGPIGSASV
jgi:polyadenylate-binding protein